MVPTAEEHAHSPFRVNVDLWVHCNNRYQHEAGTGGGEALRGGSWGCPCAVSHERWHRTRRHEHGWYFSLSKHELQGKASETRPQPEVEMGSKPAVGKHDAEWTASLRAAQACWDSSQGMPCPPKGTTPSVKSRLPASTRTHGVPNRSSVSRAVPDPFH